MTTRGLVLTLRILAGVVTVLVLFLWSYGYGDLAELWFPVFVLVCSEAVRRWGGA